MKKKEIPNAEYEGLDDFMNLLANGGMPQMFQTLFGGMPQTEKYPHERLGDGYELRKIELFNKKGNPIENRNNYSHLYHNDLKVTDLVFRKGGMGGKFRDGYCELIYYKLEKDSKKSNSEGFDFGTFVIINRLGDIVMKGGRFSSEHPHHIGGHLASVGNYIYDLRSGKEIAPKSSTTITTKNSIIIEHRYDWYDKEVKLPLGVYQINFDTAEMIKIDDIKK